VVLTEEELSFKISRSREEDLSLDQRGRGGDSRGGLLLSLDQVKDVAMEVDAGFTLEATLAALAPEEKHAILEAMSQEERELALRPVDMNGPFHNPKPAPKPNWRIGP